MLNRLALQVGYFVCHILLYHVRLPNYSHPFAIYDFTVAEMVVWARRRSASSLSVSGGRAVGSMALKHSLLALDGVSSMCCRPRGVLFPRWCR